MTRRELLKRLAGGAALCAAPIALSTPTNATPLPLVSRFEPEWSGWMDVPNHYVKLGRWGMWVGEPPECLYYYYNVVVSMHELYSVPPAHQQTYMDARKWQGRQDFYLCCRKELDVDRQKALPELRRSHASWQRRVFGLSDYCESD